MEVNVVKDNVQIIEVSKAFSKPTKYNGCVNNFNSYRYDNHYNRLGASSGTESTDDITLLTLSLPVAFKSICSGSDSNLQSDRFAESLEKMLKNNGNKKFWNLKLELIFFNDPKSNVLSGYFVFSPESRGGSKINVFERLDRKLDTFDFAWSIEVSLGHLPTVDAPVSPETLICLRAEDFEDLFCSAFQLKLRNCFPFPIPEEMKKLWEQGTTGFIYTKSSVRVGFMADVGNYVYGCMDVNKIKRRWPKPSFRQVEIVCRDGGERVPFYRELLEIESSVFRKKFEEMDKNGDGANGPLILEMDASGYGVKAFLEFVSGGPGGVSEGVVGCGGALELLKVGREYGVVVLEKAIDEIIMARGSTDFEYFLVKDVLELFQYSREVGGLKHLRDKAVRVFKKYSETASDKLLESKDYQIFLKNQPEIASELSSLSNTN